MFCKIRLKEINMCCKRKRDSLYKKKSKKRTESCIERRAVARHGDGALAHTSKSNQEVIPPLLHDKNEITTCSQTMDCISIVTNVIGIYFNK